MFGTWKNPLTWQGKSGFYDGASARIPEMLVGVDVSLPRTAAEGPRVAAVAGGAGLIGDRQLRRKARARSVYADRTSERALTRPSLLQNRDPTP